MRSVDDRDRAEPSSIAVVAGPEVADTSHSLAEAAPSRGPVLARRAARSRPRLRARDDGQRTSDASRARAATAQRSAKTRSTVRRHLGGLSRRAARRSAICRSAPRSTARAPSTGSPVPGFIGTFELLFVRTACDGSKERLPTSRLNIAVADLAARYSRLAERSAGKRAVNRERVSRTATVSATELRAIAP